MTREEHEETRRHFGVMVEEVQSQLRLVAESNAMTTEALQRLSDKVDAFRADFDGSRLETAREFAVVHHNFAELRTEIRSSHKDFDRRLKTVESRHASRR